MTPFPARLGGAALAVLLPLMAASPVLAQGAPDLRAAGYLAANCANCHGTGGASVNSLPGLAGKSREEFIKQMTDFREGRRTATLMHQLSKGYTDEQIALMAEFFSRQKAK